MLDSDPVLANDDASIGGETASTYQYNNIRGSVPSATMSSGAFSGKGKRICDFTG